MMKPAIPFDLGILISEENFGRDWSIETLAEKSDLSCEFIESLLYDKKKVPLEYASNFAKAYGTSVEFWEHSIDKHNRSIMND